MLVLRRLVPLVALASVLVVASPASAAAPSGGTQAANATQTTAELNAFLYSDDGSVTYHFDYGTTTAYGLTTPDVTAATGQGQSFREVVSGLSPSTTYHFRVVARNSSGDFVGNDLTFTTQAPPPDTDGDGFTDSMDSCPSQPGPAQGPYNAAGCPIPPDSDGDGYPDPQDPCPTKPGGAAGPNYPAGCPVPPNPDVDGDGVTNEYDECPTVKGSRDTAGCPDRDGDWVRDSEDACPDLKGSGEEGGGSGCPDKDGDGIRDSDDECPAQGGEDVGAKGCPPVFTAFSFPTENTWKMAQGGRQVAVCNDSPRTSDCTWRINVSLTKASARRLGINNRELVDRTVKTTKRQPFFKSVSGRWEWNPSKELKAALKKYGRSVTIVKTGSYKVAGSGEWRKMDKEKVVVKPKPCGWNALACAD